MLRRNRLIAAILVTLTLATGAVGGYLGRPFITKDGLGLSGKLLAIGYTAGCDGDMVKIGKALAAYDARRLVTAVLAAFLPTPASAEDACRAVSRYRSNLIVNAGETALRDCFNNNSGTECDDVIKTLKFHGMGTGTVDPAEGDTGCGTELTTQYNPDNTRATGSQTTNGTNVYRTVGTNTIDSGTPAVTEWCLHATATGASVMWSRVEFAAINLVANDAIQFTYDLTIE